MAAKKNPRIRIYKLTDAVSLEIDGKEHEISPAIAKMVGDSLFKTGCDVEAVVQARPKEAQ